MTKRLRDRPARKDSLSDFRALLGRVRSKGFKVGDRERAFAYRTGLQKALMAARVNRARSDLTEFFNALDILTKLDTQRFARQPIGHDFLLQLLEGERLPIDSEIRWLAARLKFEHRTISEHVRFLREIEALFIAEEYETGLKLLDSCEEALGRSLWSTEIRIALTQAFRGLEAQKDVLKEVRSVRRKGMWPYVANAVSVRAEPSVSISWFLEETRRRQERLKASAFTDYVAYRGLVRWPETNAACARVLRVEQNHHIVDIYETFISYLQIASTRGPTGALRQAMVEALVDLRPVEDIRLRKLDFAIAGKFDAAIPVANLQLTDLALAGTDETKMRRQLRTHFRKSQSPEAVVAMALVAGRSELALGETASQRMIIVRGLSQAFGRKGYQSTDAGRAEEKLRKLAYVFSALPFGRALLSLLEAASAPHTETAIKKIKVAALNSDAWGALDLIGFASHADFNELRNAVPRGATAALADAISGTQSGEIEGAIRSDVLALAQAINALISSKTTAASNLVVPALLSQSRIIAAQAAVVALNAYAHTGDVASASELIAREHVEHGVDPEAMPVREIYQDVDWRDLRDSATRPHLSIALSLIQSTDGDDKLRTYRRFALETLLRNFGKEKPSELRSVETNWNPAHLRYFLAKVCTSAMLDMLPAIRSSREVLEERREISGYLATLDKAESEQLRQEVFEISRELTVLDGLRTIDGSRVHVDTDSLARRLKVDLAESFQRYISLQKSVDGSAADGISALIKDFSKEQPPDYLLSMPVSEADELLVSMILRSRERFLFDVPHGLDSYISKRIRHGSIVGVVRAPAEREGLMAKRNLDGSYRTTGMWADRVSDATQRMALATAIMNTSRAIDQYLIRLKDVLLHVKSETRPHGFFEAPLTTPAYLVIRSVASSDVSLDSFIDTMFKSLWAMLSHSLLHAQSVLKGEAVAFASEQFQALRVKAQKILKNAEERAEFDAAAVNASVGMQAALLTASNWFEPAESAPRSYTLEEVVDIAVETVRATTAGFAPELQIKSNSHFGFSELALPLLCDVLYIALGNVAAHANVSGRPSVWLEANRDESGRFIDFAIENEVQLDDAEYQKLEHELSQIRTELAGSKGIGRARSEGGSGLHKLASIVFQTEGDELDFSCTRQRFRLHVKLSYAPERPF